MCVQAGQWCPVPTGLPVPTTSNPSALGCTEPGLGQGMAKVLGVPGGSAGCRWVLEGAEGAHHLPSPPAPTCPPLPGQQLSSGFAVRCLIIDIILQMAFGPANGITGVILLRVNYNQFVWDAFPVFGCNCSPRSPVAVTQQKPGSFAPGWDGDGMGWE